jgi:hypothetical protein
MGLFWGYIARFIVKKRTISGNPWHEQKDTIFRDTSGIPQLNRPAFNGVNHPPMSQRGISPEVYILGLKMKL